MFRIVHSFSVVVLIALAWTFVACVQSVPVFGGSSAYIDPFVLSNGSNLTPSDASTCDPEVEKIIKSQAWMAAQREITQNENIYARPDSVLSLSCFDSWLNYQNYYAEKHFPIKSKAGGAWTEDLMDLANIHVEADPNWSWGYVQRGMLEVLVLDQLQNVGSLIGNDLDEKRFSDCEVAKKEYYIADNFPDLMIGDRAKKIGGYSEIYSYFGNDKDKVRLDTSLLVNVNDTASASVVSYTCSVMSEVWHRTKCYDFATESSLYEEGGYSGFGHDGFYTYDDYVKMSAVKSDYRTEPEVCSVAGGGIVVSDKDVKCWKQIHGNISLPLGSLGSWDDLFFFSSEIKIENGYSWSDENSSANPSVDLFVDVYDPLFDLVSGDENVSCAPPIRTGFVVMRSGKQYYDAFCPNPGCFFAAPDGLSGTGTCSRPGSSSTTTP